MVNPKTLPPRLIGFDALKVLFFSLIVFFHSWLFIYGEFDASRFPQFFLYHWGAEYLAGWAQFVGLYVGLLAFFLHGFKQHQARPSLGRWAKYFFIFLGIFIAQHDWHKDFFELSAWPSGVYSFILLSFLFCAATRKINSFVMCIGLLVILLLWGESLFYKDLLQFSFVFPREESLTWAYWPHGLLTLFAFHFAKLRSTSKSPLSWGLVLCLFITGVALTLQNGETAPRDFGGGFSVHVFSQPFLGYFGRGLLFLVFLDFLTLPRVQGALSQTPLSRLSQLQMAQYFWLCYMMQFDLYRVFKSLRFIFAHFPVLFNFVWILVLILIEVTVYFFIESLKFWKANRQRQQAVPK